MCCSIIYILLYELNIHDLYEAKSDLKKYGILVILVDFYMNFPRFLPGIRNHFIKRIRTYQNETDPSGSRSATLIIINKTINNMYCVRHNVYICCLFSCSLVLSMSATDRVIVSIRGLLLVN